MDEVGIYVRGVEIKAPLDGAENRAQRLWAGEIARIEFKADDFEIVFLKALVAKATYFHRHHLR